MQTLRDELNKFINKCGIYRPFFKFVTKKDFENASEEELKQFEELLNALYKAQLKSSPNNVNKIVQNLFSDEELLKFYKDNKKEIRQFFRINQNYLSFNANKLKSFVFDVEKIVIVLAGGIALNYYFIGVKIIQNGEVISEVIEWKEIN